MSRAITRLLCLAGYNVVAFVLVVFFSGAGHGSYAPPAVLYSWGILPWAYGLPSDILGGPPFDMAVFVGIPLLYLFGLYYLTGLLARSRAHWVSFLPAGLHGTGVVIAACTITHGSLATTGLLTVSYAVSAPVAVLYLWCDWHLARKLSQPVASNAGIPPPVDNQTSLARRA